jgi:putative membrane protein
MLMMQGYDCGGMMNGVGSFGWPMMGGFGWVGLTIQILFWLAILALIVWAIMRIFPRNRHTGTSQTHTETAEEILRQRYARGEIDDKEYEARQNVLLGKESLQ